MEPIYIVAFISFALGAMGYTIVQFWLRPILRYKKIKRSVVTALLHYMDEEAAEGTVKTEKKPIEEKRSGIRRYSVEMSDCHSYDLPRWYKLLLHQLGESPIDASKHLLKLSDTRKAEHAVRHVEKIKEYLGINKR